jgi:tRNA nucleotidyltransferase (CCA-adding enzyme)
VTSHGRFGTAKWHLREISLPENGKKLVASGLHELDLVSARTEFYTYPTALPTVERGSIKLDLHRRDFTINTLALRLDGSHYGELHDYWGGMEDLYEGVVKVLHSLSFVDDPTRILRAVRFEQRLNFSIDNRTMELLIEARPLVERLSGDRIRHELNHIFNDPMAAKIMQRLQNLELLEYIHPALFWDDWLTNRLDEITSMHPENYLESDKAYDIGDLRNKLSYMFWMLRLNRDELTQVIKRLKLSMVLAKEIQAANRLYRKNQELKQHTPSQITNFLDDIPDLAIYCVQLAVSDSNVKELFHKYLKEWSLLHPSVDGNDLKKLGIPPGPDYRRILGRLRDAWLDGEIINREDEQALLQSLLLR